MDADVGAVADWAENGLGRSAIEGFVADVLAPGFVVFAPAGVVALAGLPDVPEADVGVCDVVDGFALPGVEAQGYGDGDGV